MSTVGSGYKIAVSVTGPTAKLGGSVMPGRHKCAASYKACIM